MFTESVGRLLKPLEEEIITDIVAYPDERKENCLLGIYEGNVQQAKTVEVS
ncbi:hypothetical protein NST21_07365 [Peribacillus sp. FSL K6-1552]|uniref:hypothetical protein n=1 Tax=Peribacillus sp. FSL K6-1552 TaxID=2954514 RepID=UPI0030F52B7F